MYWELSSNTYLRDERFNHKHFAAQPLYLVRQGLKAVRNARNVEHLTLARQLQAFTNVNRGEDTQPYDDISLFLPHPAEFRLQSTKRTLNVSRQTAIAVLQSIDWLDSSVLAAIDAWLTELEIIAQG